MSCFIQLLSILICICALSCEAKNTKDLIHYQVYNPYPATSVHVITVDPKQVKIIATRAQEAGHGLDSVGNIARHSGAIAAINGGFFRLNSQLSSNAVPAGVLKINNIWHGIAYKPRGAIGWDPETNKILFDIVQTDSQILLQDQSMPINAMNKLVQGNRATLLSDSYSDAVDITNNIGIIILDQRVQAVYDNGKVLIPADGYVYNLNGNLRAQIKNIKPGDAAIVKINIKPQLESSTVKQWNKMPFIVGGGPLLINKGKKITNFSVEQMHADFLNGHHARTAIGILPDKRWVLVVADRSPLEGIGGLSIPQLRDFMYSLGCVAALNLDGGGSSSMYIEDFKYGSITDQPVADALVIIPRD